MFKKTKKTNVLRNGLEKENKQKKMKKDKSTTYRKKSTSSAGAQTTSAVLSLCHSVHVWFVFRAETLSGSAAAAHGKICGRETGRGAVFSRIRGERWAAMSHRPRGTPIASHMHMHAHAHAQARSSWTAVACGQPTLNYDLFSSVRRWWAPDLLCQWLV